MDIRSKLFLTILGIMIFSAPATANRLDDLFGKARGDFNANNPTIKPEFNRVAPKPVEPRVPPVPTAPRPMGGPIKGHDYVVRQPPPPPPQPIRELKPIFNDKAMRRF